MTPHPVITVPAWAPFPRAFSGTLDPSPRTLQSHPAMASEPRKPKKEVRVRQVPAVSRSIAILRLLGNTRQGLGVRCTSEDSFS